MTATLTRGRVDELRRALARARAANRRRPLRYMAGTRPQVAVWSHPSKRRLYRTGNQVGGKTHAGLTEVVWWATGTHPFRHTPRRPVQIWVVCVSLRQSKAIQRKLWKLLPKDELADPNCYNAETGFGANNPVVTFKNGSQVWIRTWNQDPLELAGETLDFVLADEPPKRQRSFSELERRLTRSGGSLLLTMTPVNARIDWLRELAESGAITDLHFPATPEMLTLSDGTPLYTDTGEIMDAAWLADQRTKVMRFEEPVVIDGEWEMRADGAIFESYDGHRHEIVDLLNNREVGPRGCPIRLCLGIDWGDESLRTAAVLVAVQAGDLKKGVAPRVWVLDEYVAQGPSTEDMDAAAVLAMLASNGLQWTSLAAVYGDKRYTDARGHKTIKSNATFEAVVARRLGLGGTRTVPRVLSAKKGAGAGANAKWSSVRWINAQMITPGGFAIDKRRCAGVVDAILSWDGTDKHVAKDRLDALRYSLRDYWTVSRRGKGRGTQLAA